MISADYVRAMAAYNRWQNSNLYGAAKRVSDSERKIQRGAYFGSIHSTLNHLLWGDQIWMSRFTSSEPPPSTLISDSTEMYPDWDDLVTARIARDDAITLWAANLDLDWLKSDLTWTSAALNRPFTQPVWILVTHMFNHQTHHRGQIHAMLTAAGTKPDDDTDLPFMPA